jgi:hypothetical protein
MSDKNKEVLPDIEKPVEVMSEDTDNSGTAEIDLIDSELIEEHSSESDQQETQSVEDSVESIEKLDVEVSSEELQPSTFGTGPVEELVPEAVAIEIAEGASQEFDEESIKEGIEKLADQREKVSDQISSLEVIREQNQLEVENLIAIREDLNQWTSVRKESFAWRLVGSLRNFEADLKKDEEAVKTFSSSPPDIDVEFGAKTRRWIMRMIGWGFFVGIGLVYLTELIHKYSDTVTESDPTNPAVSVSVNLFDQWLRNFFGINHSQLQFLFIFFLLAYLIGVFQSYSRRTSEFRQIVAIETEKTKIIVNAVHLILLERERIDSLHPQVPQILEILSLGLHQPWQINSKYSNFEGNLPDVSKIPESLDIAVPTKKSAQKVFSNLVYRAMNEIQVPGWREEAFQRVIQRLAEGAGFGQANSALKELDQDQRRGGRREMLISLEEKESILLGIGDELVADFAATVQEKVLPLAQPDVISLRPDDLAPLLLSDSLVSVDNENVSPWEVKLAEISGAGSPWSAATFSIKGQIAAKHETKPESVLIATDRVCTHAHQEVQRHNKVYAGTRPFEVSIRVDLSEWCHPEEVAIFQDYQPTEKEIEFRRQQDGSKNIPLEHIHDLSGTLLN